MAVVVDPQWDGRRRIRAAGLEPALEGERGYVGCRRNHQEVSGDVATLRMVQRLALAFCTAVVNAAAEVAGSRGAPLGPPLALRLTRVALVSAM